jgi:uncharacterized protein (TIGR02677 family)
MTQQLPTHVLGAAVRFAADAAAPASPSQPTPEVLRAQPALRYATVEDAERYRRIMRVLFLEHQGFGLRLRPDQVAERLHARFGLREPAELLDERLGRLAEWGAVDREHDASLATTAAEWRRNRYTYDVTPAGRLTEGLLAQLDDLGYEHGVLDGQRIPAIRDALNRLATELEAPAPDGPALRALLEQALGQVEALHTGALTFMKSLGQLIRRSELVDEQEFDASKGTLLDHLQGFRRDRRRWAAEVLDALDRVEHARSSDLVALIVAAEEFVTLPGGSTAEQQRARRTEELTRQWRGVRAWFVGDQDAGSPWRALNDGVVDAIRAVLEIAERLIERRSSRVDRASVLLHLAARAAGAPPGEAPAWVRAACGLLQPRHVGAAEEDPEQVRDRGRTSWRDAPGAPVVAHLRRPGARTPGTGRGARVPDLSDGRARMARRRAAERAELTAVLERFADRGAVRLSDVAKVDERELSHLLAWISRAYEAPARDGVRRAGSSDGRAEIRLVEPENAVRTTLRAPHGTLETPDYRLEVTLR